MTGVTVHSLPPLDISEIIILIYLNCMEELRFAYNTMQLRNLLSYKLFLFFYNKNLMDFIENHN